MFFSVSKFYKAQPDRLLLVPAKLSNADNYTGEEIINDRFLFAGKIIDAHIDGAFQSAKDDIEFGKYFHSFEWLSHLNAVNNERADEKAQNLTEAWINRCGARQKGPEWNLYITAQRLMVWLSYSPMILRDTDNSFYGRFLEALMLHQKYLKYAVSFEEDLIARIKARMAIVLADLCIPPEFSSIERSGVALEDELDRQILVDGGHVSRNPATILEILSDLLPLRQTYIDLELQVPPKISTLIDRMFRTLRFFKHSSGDLARFNGSGFVRADYLMSILQNDERVLENFNRLPDSGYYRLETGQSTLLVDAGHAPTGIVSKYAHAGALSFEFSSGANQIIVNAGAPVLGVEDYSQFARLTAAHSTLVINDTSSARISNSTFLGPIIYKSPKNVDAEHVHVDMQMGLDCSHDGYKKVFGLVHKRQFRLHNDGKLLTGMDVLDYSKKARSDNLQVDIRFHIHPTISLSQHADGAVLLTTRDKEYWAFSSVVHPRIEQDIFFGDILPARSSQQLVLSFSHTEYQRVAWILKKLG